MVENLDGGGSDTLIQEDTGLEGAKWTKRFYLSRQVLDIRPVSFLASTSVTRAKAAISWTQCDKYNKADGSGGEEKIGMTERQAEPLFHEGCDGKVTPGFRPCSFPRAVIAPCSHFLPRLGHMLHLAAGAETRSGNTLNKRSQASVLSWDSYRGFQQRWCRSSAPNRRTQILF